MKVISVNPRGYCYGVINAISLAIKTRKENPSKKIYIYGMLVHNEDVIKFLNKNDITTLETNNSYVTTLKQLEKGSILVFTAHGHTKEIENFAKQCDLIVIDATCKKVAENINLIQKQVNNGGECIYIGKNNHPETMTAISNNPNVFLYEQNKEFNFNQLKTDNPLVINQTTLSHLELEKEHKNIKSHLKNANIINEICDATLLRQKALLSLPNDVDLIIIVGGIHSSNTNKLYEIAKQNYPKAHIIKVLNKTEIQKNDLKGRKFAAVASGTSTPLETSNEIIEFLKSI